MKVKNYGFLGWTPLSPVADLFSFKLSKLSMAFPFEKLPIIAFSSNIILKFRFCLSEMSSLSNIFLKLFIVVRWDYIFLIHFRVDNKKLECTHGVPESIRLAWNLIWW